jgi:hypothetical protein
MSTTLRRSSTSRSDASPADTGLAEPERGDPLGSREIEDRGPTGFDALIEQAIDRALGLGIEQRMALGRAARRAYEAGRQSFEERLGQFLRDEVVPLG